MELVVVQRPKVILFRRGYDIVKRLLDVLLCLVALPFALPFMGICAVLIWMHDGWPVLYASKRTGRGGHRFEFYKFRTMVTNAAELKQKYMHRNELTWPDFKITNDPRITPIGRFLRKTSLDELPQIFNVLKGDMSLVGPRPTSWGLSDHALWHTERLEVLPGITGLWQVSGRSDVDFEGRMRLDIEYIERRSLWLDLTILAKTFSAVVSRRGAY